MGLPPSDRALIVRAVERVVIKTGTVEIHLTKDVGLDQTTAFLSIPWSKPPVRRHRDVLQPSGKPGDDQAARSEESRTKLLETIVKACSWLDEIVVGGETIETIARREGRSERSVRTTLSLAFLPPDVVRALINGTLSGGVTAKRLIDLPMGWREQSQVVSPGHVRVNVKSTIMR